jgi:CheY-like chemotaxis protein
MTRVLVVDDDPTLADLIETLMPEWEVHPALNGLAAFDAARRAQINHTRIDLVVLDICIPELSGYEICARLRKLCPDTPFQPITALREDDPRLRPELFSELGCAPLLFKGISPTRLIAHLNDMLAMTPHVQSSAILDQLQQAVEEKERRLRQEQTNPRAAIFATSVLGQLALKTLLETRGIEVTAVESTAHRTRRVLQGTNISLLAVQSRDIQTALRFLTEFRTPTLVIAANITDGMRLVPLLFEAYRDTIPIGIVVDNTRIYRQLHDALDSLVRKESFMDPQLDLSSNDQLRLAGDILRAEIGNPELMFSEAEIRFLLIIAQDSESDDEIADRLNKNNDYVYRTRHRLRQKLGKSAVGLRQLARIMVQRLQLAEQNNSGYP